MDQPSLTQVFNDLFEWCRERNFAGHDPFDALNSGAFQRSPFNQSRVARLGWTQLLKRSPLDLRALTRVPAEKNAKGIALFALAALANFRRQGNDEAKSEARRLLDDLSRMKIDGYSGAAWGYNFDWQSRNFFAPKGTPTIVPTAFAAHAFLDAFTTLKDEQYLQLARDACEFILNDLNRTFESPAELCFSYSPLDQTQIFNASLFAAGTLARVGFLTHKKDLCDPAFRAARFVTKRQQANGSWTYGTGASQSWIDNFHTAYVLISLNRIMRCSAEARTEFEPALRRGFEFWRETFFLADGWPKYYHDALYPADAHAAATAIVALVELQELDSESLAQARRVAGWAIQHLRDPGGFFYYQRRRFHTVRIPFMRWTQSWMLYALGRLLEQ
jgi:hypothetical protein